LSILTEGEALVARFAGAQTHIDEWHHLHDHHDIAIVDG
jgi:hypothetical protein